jgi:hypothetical protein
VVANVGIAEMEQEWPEIGLAELHILNFSAYSAFFNCLF